MHPFSFALPLLGTLAAVTRHAKKSEIRIIVTTATSTRENMVNVTSTDLRKRLAALFALASVAVKNRKSLVVVKLLFADEHHAIHACEKLRL
jgi:hypothetical protein